METTKMSLANIKGKLSRAEMKNNMAGSGWSCGGYGIDNNCWYVGQSCGNGGSFCFLDSSGYCCIHG